MIGWQLKTFTKKKKEKRKMINFSGNLPYWAARCKIVNFPLGPQLEDKSESWARSFCTALTSSVLTARSNLKKKKKNTSGAGHYSSMQCRGTTEVRNSHGSAVIQCSAATCAQTFTHGRCYDAITRLRVNNGIKIFRCTNLFRHCYVHNFNCIWDII